MKVYTKEEKVYIWLDSFPLDAGEKKRLLKEAGSPAALTRDFRRFRESLIKSVGESVYNNMLASLSDGGAYFQRVEAELDRRGTLAIPRDSELYPPSLLNLREPPLVLYAKGDAALLKTRLFTVVGSRRTPAAALRIGAEICKELSAAFTIVTGTADGGDSAAIEGALKGGGKVISLAAGGFSALPQGNLDLLSRAAKSGLLLSACPFDTPVRPYSYESRNALLAALGEGTLVLGAGGKSGALITAGYAKTAGKPVFALPYAPGSESGAGCNALIKKGAYLTENSVDIFMRFGINLIKEKSCPPLTKEETAVLSALKELAEAHVFELAERSGVPLFKLYGILSSLEIKGLAVRLGGNRYAPV